MVQLRIEDVKFAVIGAGNGGCSMAGHLALMGFEVNLFNRSQEKLKGIKDAGGILIEGEAEGFGKLKEITSDMEQAIRDVDVIMITTPASGHRDIGKLVAPYLDEEQIIVLNPGRTGGALEFRNLLNKLGVRKDIIVAEAQTFIYASRIVGPANARIHSIKKKLNVAALPAFKTQKVIDRLNLAYPQVTPANSVLETSLNNIGAIFHPAPTILNSGRIESTKGDFRYYTEGISPSVAKVIEQIDNERLEVAKALGVEAYSATEWLNFTYGSEGKNLYESIQNCNAYQDLKAPDNVNVRYIFEDIPESLVPISSIASVLGIKTPIIDATIEMANIMHGVDYWQLGRTSEKLGLKGLSVTQIHQLVTEGNVIPETKTTDEDEVVA